MNTFNKVDGIYLCSGALVGLFTGYNIGCLTLSVMKVQEVRLKENEEARENFVRPIKFFASVGFLSGALVSVFFARMGGFGAFFGPTVGMALIGWGFTVLVKG